MSFTIKGILVAFIVCFLINNNLTASDKNDGPVYGVHASDHQEKYNSATGPSVNDEIAAAAGAINKVESLNRFTNNLSASELNVLPIGLKFNEGGSNNTKVTIAVSSVVFTPEFAELNVYAKVTIPQQPGELFFGAKGIKLSYSGGIIGDARLVLLGDVSIPVYGGIGTLVLKGSSLVNNITPDRTYVSMDCKGFKELGLAADVILSPGLFIPVDLAGNENVSPEARVTGSFTTVVRDWNDIMADIILPSFAIRGLNGFSFTVNHAVFDFSDTRNSNNISFPPGYQEKYMMTGIASLWRGLYFENLTVMLPGCFGKRGSGVRPSFAAYDMLIDNNGISGTCTGKDILSFDDGNASGWPFSVTGLSLVLEASRLKGLMFNGELGMPLLKGQTLLYQGAVDADNNYLLAVSPPGELNFNLWQAQARIDRNSYVEFKVVDGKFRPMAMLNGRMTMAPAISPGAAAVAKMNDIVFNGLKLQTELPYLSVNYLGYEGGVKVKNFPATINTIGLEVNNDQARLAFDLNVELSDKLLSGTGRFELIATMNNTNGIHSWEFKRVNMERLHIESTISGEIKVEGNLVMLNGDPVYGDGFRGEIKAGFPKLKLGNMQALAVFGKTDFNYWFVDVQADLGKTGIPVMGPFSIRGFGGGAYYSMSKLRVSKGASPTGMVYKPDRKVGLGIRAAVLFQVGKKEVADGQASFEAAFNKNGGVNYLGFFGEMSFMSVIPGADNVNSFLGDKFSQISDKLTEVAGNNPDVLAKMEKLKVEEPSKAADLLFPSDLVPGTSGFTAKTGIQYDFSQQIFHANFDLYVNAAAGSLRGTASGNRAGWAVMHIAPQEWYVHLGTPTDRLGLQFGIGDFSIKTGAYFMMGDRIPGSPAPPREVAEILGVETAKLDYMRDLNALGDGRGLAFGSNIAVSTGDITVLLVYANFNAGVGFDVMLKDYGQDVSCAGKTGSIGINGWYANGQAYGYLQGEVGVKVNLLFVKARIPIIKGGAATLFQAKLPNPSWFQGYLGVQFNVLGGLVKGRVRLKITLGKECEFVGGNTNPAGIQIISDLSPKNGDAEADVFTAPQAVFNMRVGTPFDVEDDKGRQTYRIKLEKFTVNDNGKTIPGDLSWNNSSDAVTFYSKEILPPKANLKALVKVSFEQQNGSTWQTVYINGRKIEEEKEISFTTGAAPETVPLSNIVYSYPVVDQQNYYKAESKSAYIRLKRGQYYLFSNTSVKQEIRLSDGSQRLSAPFSYDQGTSEIRFTMPNVALKTGYTLELISLPAASAENNTTGTYAQVAAGEDNSVEIRNNQANAVQRGDISKVILSYPFTTSASLSFEDKLKGASFKRSIWSRISSDVIDLQTEVASYEPFDVTELSGSQYTGFKPLVEATASLQDNYYQADIFPLIYEKYPLAGNLTLSNRDVNEYGIIPARAMPVMNNYLADIQQGIKQGIVSSRMPYIYHLPEVYKQDFTDLQNQVVNRYLGTAEQSKYSYLIMSRYPFISHGYYTVIYQYIMPNGEKGTRFFVKYYNEIK